MLQSFRPLLVSISKSILKPTTASYPSASLSRHKLTGALQQTHLSSRANGSPEAKPRKENLVSITSDESDDFNNDFYNREFVDMSVEDFEELYKHDPSGTVKDIIEAALSEYEYTKYNMDGRVPAVITMSEMSQIIEEGTSPNQRERLFNFFFKREMVKRAQERKKLEEKKQIEQKQQTKIKMATEKLGRHGRTGLLSEEGHIIYGLWHNSLFPRIMERELKCKQSTNSLIRAAIGGRRLIFDFDYDELMSKGGIRSLCEQVQIAYGLNRFQQHEEIFDIWFCNFRKGSPSETFMRNNAIRNLDSGSMITAVEDCFTNHFDKSKLVYLSPNAREKLTSVANNDDIYIIGAFNDKGVMKPLSQSKANRLGIRSRSLPLDRYVAWKGPSKSLCVNHVTGILVDMLNNGDNWREALVKNIPTRKIKPLELVVEEERLRRERRAVRTARSKFSLKDIDL